MTYIFPVYAYTLIRTHKFFPFFLCYVLEHNISEVVVNENNHSDGERKNTEKGRNKRQTNQGDLENDSFLVSDSVR